MWRTLHAKDGAPLELGSRTLCQHRLADSGFADDPHDLPLALIAQRPLATQQSDLIAAANDRTVFGSTVGAESGGERPLADQTPHEGGVPLVSLAGTGRNEIECVPNQSSGRFGCKNAVNRAVRQQRRGNQWRRSDHRRRTFGARAFGTHDDLASGDSDANPDALAKVLTCCFNQFQRRGQRSTGSILKCFGPTEIDQDAVTGRATRGPIVPGGNVKRESVKAIEPLQQVAANRVAAGDSFVAEGTCEDGDQPPFVGCEPCPFGFRSFGLRFLRLGSQCYRGDI